MRTLETHPIVTTVRRFVQTEVLPVASDLDHADAYPHVLVARMRELGLFGALVPTAFGGLGLDVSTYARVIEELCRGWMSLAGVLNSHTMAALIVWHHGTDEQRQRFLPRFARGDARGGLCLTEPQAGSDVQAIRTVARRRGDEYLLDGTKMFVTNGREGNTFALLALTDPMAVPRHRGMSCFVVEKGHPGLRVVKSIDKLGYKGVDTAELLFEEFPVPAANLVGGVEGRGFRHVMSGLETGRINIAARAVGVGQAALDAALGVARRGRAAPPALVTMAARLSAARLLTYWAADMKDRQERCDLEAGMAKLSASETAQALAVEALRIEGAPAALLTSDVERLYRDTPLMIIGEGTNEIQRTLIARQLIDRHGERLGALTSREHEPTERRHMLLAVRQFAEKSLAPIAAEHDRAARYPEEMMPQLADLGLLGTLVAPEYGGLGLDVLTHTMLLEELGRGWTMLATAVSAHAATASVLARFGAVSEQRRLLPAMTRAELLASAALETDVHARRDGDTYVLTGVTLPVAHASRATLVLVEARGDDGPLVAVVTRDAAGLTIGAPEPTLGERGLEAARLRFTDVRLAASAVLPQARPAARALVWLGEAGIAVGVAQAAFEAALRYSQQRVTFGKPIHEHQAIQLKLADMATAVTAARLLTYHAADRLALDDDLATGLARVYAGDMAYEVTLEAMRIHGGYGYTTEFPVERYYRDAARFVATPDATARAELAARLVAAVSV